VCADNTAKSEEIYTLEAITEYRVVFTWMISVYVLIILLDTIIL
jgi:hypothetical protein